jgi:AcrR family transcriptional regulator
MSPRSDVSEERKKQILDAASNVFARSGLDDARMDDIAEESGLSKGSLYWYFKNKDAIIQAIMENMLKREISKIREMVREDISAKDKLDKFVQMAVKDLNLMKPMLPILYEFLAIGFRKKKVRNSIKEYLNSYIKEIIPIVQQGIDNGEFRNVNAEETALALGAVFEGSILIWSYDPKRINLEKMLQSTVDLLFEGLESK